VSGGSRRSRRLRLSPVKPGRFGYIQQQLENVLHSCGVVFGEAQIPFFFDFFGGLRRDSGTWLWLRIRVHIEFYFHIDDRLVDIYIGDRLISLSRSSCDTCLSQPLVITMAVTGRFLPIRNLGPILASDGTIHRRCWDLTRRVVYPSWPIQLQASLCPQRPCLSLVHTY
jgi:hypothetical protein